MSNDGIFLADMSWCLPSEALSGTAKHGHWQLVPYRTDEVSGTMVLARPETDAPQLTLQLGAVGWHAVYLGFMGQTWAGSPMLRVKLSGDPCFVRVGTQADIRHLEEGFWKIADLTGLDLVIAQQPPADAQPASLAYVRLVPQDEEEVEARRERSGTRRLIALHDAFGYSRSAQDIQEEIEPYRDTDFGKLFWEAWQADTPNYPAKVGGAPFGHAAEDFTSPVYRRIAESLHEMKTQGLDSLQVALQCAHGMGLQFHASMRFMFGMCPPAEMFDGPFLAEHPEFLCRDYDGTEVSHPSFAFPEVRRYVLSLLEDVARYDVDGLNPIFVRGQPHVLYEKPLVEGFRKQTGIDPTRLAQHDPRWRWYELEAMPTFWYGDRPAMEAVAQERVTRLDELTDPVQRWLRYRAEPLTTFMRGLRELVEREGKGQRVCATVFANEADNLFYGLDVERWVGERLVDLLIPYPWPEYFELDMGFFRRITLDSACEVYPNLVPRQMPPEEYLEKAIRHYEGGAHGLAFWDALGRTSLLNEWQAARELGHQEQLRDWLAAGRFPRKLLLLRRLGRYTMDRYYPGSGG